jgi:type IV secretory pathway VirB10-like protein
MKKIALAAFSATALLALSACGDAAEEAPAEDTAMEEAAPVEPVVDDATAAAEEATDDAAAAADDAEAAADEAAGEAPAIPRRPVQSGPARMPSGQGVQAIRLARPVFFACLFLAFFGNALPARRVFTASPPGDPR